MLLALVPPLTSCSAPSVEIMSVVSSSWAFSFPSDLMTEMMDLTSDLVGTGIPFLDYKSYAERIFFPGHRESPLQRDLDIPECRRQTVEQGLVQLSNLLNSKLFLTKVMSLSLLAACCEARAIALAAGGGQCLLRFIL